MRTDHIVALATAILFGCADAQDTSTVSPGTLRMTLSGPTTTADAAGLIAITIVGGGDILRGRKQVSVTTSLGMLTSNAAGPVTGSPAITLGFGTDSTVQLFLRSGREPGTAVIQAVVANGLALDTVRFLPSYPTSVFLGLGAATLSDTVNGSTLVTLQLRSSGTLPSIGLVGEFTARDTLGRSVGVFGPVTRSDTAGQIATTFYVGPGVPQGPVSITGSVRRSSPDTVLSSSAILLVRP